MKHSLTLVVLILVLVACKTEQNHTHKELEKPTKNEFNIKKRTQQDYEGTWHGKYDIGQETESDIELKIYTKNNTVFADIKTGEEVYEQFTEALILRDDKLISKPSSSIKVIIDFETTQPKQLSLYLDNNPEFEPIRAKLSAVDTSKH